MKMAGEPAPARRKSVRLDREPIFLYRELDDRGWSYEIVAASREDAATRTT
jgi:hypothetical protein